MRRYVRACHLLNIEPPKSMEEQKIKQVDNLTRSWRNDDRDGGGFILKDEWSVPKA